MRTFNLPAIRPADRGNHPESGPPPSAPAPSRDQPVSVPEAGTATSSARKEVFAVLSRLRASFARAEAVHQARLDAGWNAPERYLLAQYACSAK